MNAFVSNANVSALMPEECLVQQLIGKLETASGPSRELDEAIASAVLTDAGYTRLVGGESYAIKLWRYADGSTRDALRYTSSVDAALTLVPEGWDYKVIDHRNLMRGNTSHKWVSATVWRAHKGDYGDCDNAACNPALALTIAALKALSSSVEGKE